MWAEADKESGHIIGTPTTPIRKASSQCQTPKADLLLFHKEKGVWLEMCTKATLIEKESGKVKLGNGEAQIWGFCCEEETDLVRVVCVEFGYTSNVPTVKARRPLCVPLAAHQAASINKTTCMFSGLNKSCYYTVYSGVYPFNPMYVM